MMNRIILIRRAAPATLRGSRPCAIPLESWPQAMSRGQHANRSTPVLVPDRCGFSRLRGTCARGRSGGLLALHLGCVARARGDETDSKADYRGDQTRLRNATVAG